MWASGDDVPMEETVQLTPEQDSNHSATTVTMDSLDACHSNDDNSPRFGFDMSRISSLQGKDTADVTLTPHECSSSSPSTFKKSDDEVDPRVERWIQLFHELSGAEQRDALTSLVDVCSMTNIRHVRHLIEPHFQRDFLSCLPVELGMNIIRKLEGSEMIKLSSVSKNWRMLSETDAMWRNLFDPNLRSLPDPSNRVDGAWAITALLSPGVNIPDHLCRTSLIAHRNKKTSNKVGSVFHRATEKSKYMRRERITQNWRERPIRGSCVLRGHDDHVITCMEIHEDLLVTGSDDNTLKVWSIDGGHLLFSLVGHTGGVWTSQISDDGKYIVSGSTDRTIKVWSATDGTLVHTLVGHTSTVRCMSIFKHLLVTGSRDTSLRVWDIEKAVCKLVLNGHQAAVRCVQFDGEVVVSGGYDFCVKVWSATTGVCLKTLNGHTNRVYSLLFESARGIVASGSLDTTIRVWDITKPEGEECIALLNGHTSLTSGMQLKGNILVSCNADSHVRVWDIRDGTCVYHLNGHRSAITSLQFFDENVVATSSDDGTVKLWDVKKGIFLRDLVILGSGGNGGCIWRLCATPTLLACAAGSRNNTEETKVILIDFDACYP